jgi:hypothetical protein
MISVMKDEGSEEPKYKIMFDGQSDLISYWRIKPWLRNLQSKEAQEQKPKKVTVPH